MIDLFNKGSYKPIDGTFLSESICVMQKLTKLQKDYERPDIDNFLNEIHDSLVGRYLGFELINTEKHGFDCKYSKDKDIYLESKVCGFSAKSWSATFNDTTLEKAEAFKSKNLWLALSIWNYSSELLCIIYGQNKKIGEFLYKKVIEQTANSQRRTQTIGISKLINDYGFDILTIDKTPAEIRNILISKSGVFRHLDMSRIHTLLNFKELG